jgi:hypothetical protein
MKDTMHVYKDTIVNKGNITSDNIIITLSSLDENPKDGNVGKEEKTN